MLRRNHLLFIFLSLTFIGCTKDMDIQNKLNFQTYKAPAAPLGTITTTGQDSVGQPPAKLVTLTADEALLKRGQVRYEIHCTPCHDRTGSGNGLVVQRGFPHPLAFSDASVKGLSDQAIFDAVTNGYKKMAGYKTFISTDDRIAIVAYVRVLQLAQSFPVSSLQAIDRDHLDKSGAQ